MCFCLIAEKTRENMTMFEAGVGWDLDVTVVRCQVLVFDKGKSTPFRVFE